MARIRGHEYLNEDRDLFVLRGSVDAPMVVDGRTFMVGDPFPWRELAGVTPRLLRKLHEQRRVGHERPGDPAQGAEPPPGTRAAEEAIQSARTPARPPAPKQAPSQPSGKVVPRAQARG